MSYQYFIKSSCQSQLEDRDSQSHYRTAALLNKRVIIKMLLPYGCFELKESLGCEPMGAL